MCTFLQIFNLKLYVFPFMSATTSLRSSRDYLRPPVRFHKTIIMFSSRAIQYRGIVATAHSTTRFIHASPATYKTVTEKVTEVADKVCCVQKDY